MPQNTITSKKKIIAKVQEKGVFAIPYTNKNGYEFKREFYDKGFKRKELPNRYLDDKLPNTIAITGGRNGLIKRLQARVCEKLRCYGQPRNAPCT